MNERRDEQVNCGSNVLLNCFLSFAQILNERVRSMGQKGIVYIHCA